MATNLNLDTDIAEIKALPANSTAWAPRVARLLRKLFHSSENPWGPNAVRDAFSEGSGFPIGGMIAVSSDNVTTPGFVSCDGRSLSRTEHSDLFKVIGTRFGSANSGVFSVPNLIRRQIIGRSTDFPIGTRSGSETKLMSVNELPTHRHGHSSVTVSEVPDHGHSLRYVYGKDEFPDLDAGSVAIISPCPNLHVVPDGTQGWRFIQGNPNDFPAGRSGTPASSYSGSDGAHGHQMRGAVTEGYGGGKEISIIGPSMVMDWRIYSGVV